MARWVTKFVNHSIALVLRNRNGLNDAADERCPINDCPERVSPETTSSAVICNSRESLLKLIFPRYPSHDHDGTFLGLHCVPDPEAYRSRRPLALQSRSPRNVEAHKPARYLSPVSAVRFAAALEIAASLSFGSVRSRSVYCCATSCQDI
jgi:hypothetical protein